MAETEKQSHPEEKSKTFSIKAILMMVVVLVAVVILLGTSGYGMGKLVFDMLKPKETQAVEELDGLKQDAPAKKTADSDTEDGWYYDLEPVVANLDEPGATRYVRATVTLEISNDLEQGKGRALIDEKTPHLRNWLVIYLAGLTLDDARGEKNLKRIQTHILDAFNETLFADDQPHIKRILFKEGFAIQ